MADRPGPPKVRMRTKPQLATAAEMKEYEQTRAVAPIDVAAAVEESAAIVDVEDVNPEKSKAVSTRVGSIFSKKPAVAAIAAAQIKAAEAAKPPPAASVVAAAPPKPKAEEKPKVVLDFEDLPDISEFNKKIRPLAQGILEETYRDPYYLKADAPVGDPRHLASSFVPTTRRGFADFIQTQFRHFELPKLKAPDPEACAKQGVKGAEQLQIYLYQQFIREYMRSETPYRGILVYHGLGSGKTCSAIAASEALFARARKKIIIMTPKSLRRNFTKELMTCGFQHYRLQNYWVEMEKTATSELFARTILNLPDSYIKKASAFFVPDFEKMSQPNYNTLEPSQQKQIYAQIQAMIDNQFMFIHYNGVTPTRLKEWACTEPSQRIFDNAVIVIDEIHNLIRLMQETIEPYLQSVANLRRKIQPEPITVGRWNPGLCGQIQNYKRGFLFYRLLLDAQNSKIIGLSGTPLINYPEEIAILMNVLHGYIQVAEFKIVRASDSQIQEFILAAKNNLYIDFVEVKKSGEGATVVLTPLPQRTIKKFSGSNKEMRGVARVDDKASYPDFVKVVADFKGSFAGKLKFSETTFKAEPLLPPFGKQFNETFIDTIRGTIQKDKEIVLAKRMTGLISYYRGSKEELMPKVLCDEVVNCPMSQYQQAEYMKIRNEEIEKEELEKKTRKSQGMGAKQAAIWTDIYDVKLKKQQSSYRMASRQCCNFAFPPEVARPRPNKENKKKAEEEELLEIGEEPEEIIDADIEGGKESEEDKKAAKAAKAEDEEIERKEKNAAKKVAQGKAAAGSALEEEEDEEEEEKSKAASTVKARRAPSFDLFGGDSDDDDDEPNTDERREACRATSDTEDYQEAMDRAKECLKEFCMDKLELATKPTDKKLNVYSPKYQAMLERIRDSPGSNLVYSQFLQMEGIGIFALAMLANGYKPIRIENEGGNYKFTKSTLKNLKKKDVPRFLMFTGDEEEDIRKLYLDVFNVKLMDLPESLRKPLQDNGYTDNKQGQLARVFCITSAGAEGLSLKNVRRVHIMETYWNDVRLTQVKGRAIRICSHVDFERVEDRSVEIFTYVSTYDERALLGKPGWIIDEEVIKADVMVGTDEELVSLGLVKPKGAPNYVLTSDERLKLTSERKRNITRNLENIMKAVAVDCRLNFAENGIQKDPPKKCGVSSDGSEKPAIPCLYLEGKVGDFLYHPLLDLDLVSAKEFKLAEPEVVKAFTYQPDKTVDVKYIVLPITDAVTKLVTSFDIYSYDDRSFTKKVGIMRAHADGRPDKASFHLYTKDELEALEPKKEEEEEEAKEEAKAVSVPSTLEDIEAMVLKTYPDVIERTKERIKRDTFLDNPMLVDDFESIETSSNKNDCLVHSFLLLVSPSFRKLTTKEKDAFADTFRRKILPQIYKAHPGADRAEIRQLSTSDFLDDRHQASLAKFFPVNIVNFLSNDGKMEPLAETADYKENVPFIFIYNPDRMHYRAVRKLNKGVSKYTFTKDEALKIIRKYIFGAPGDVQELVCEFKDGEEVMYNGEKKKIVERVYSSEDTFGAKECIGVRFVLLGDVIPLSQITKIGAPAASAKPGAATAAKPAGKAPPSPSDSEESGSEDSGSEESGTDESGSDSENEADNASSEKSLQLNSNSDEEEEEKPEFLTYTHKYEGKKTKYNILPIKDPKTKKIIRFDAYLPADNPTVKLGTFVSMIDDDGDVVPDKTTFKPI